MAMKLLYLLRTPVPARWRGAEGERASEELEKISAEASEMN